MEHERWTNTFEDLGPLHITAIRVKKRLELLVTENSHVGTITNII